MLHLTLTGPNAGQVICGMTKAEKYESNDTFAHGIYFFDAPEFPANLCPKCRDILLEVESEEYYG